MIRFHGVQDDCLDQRATDVSGMQTPDGVGAHLSLPAPKENTFECSTCERTEVVRFAVDPMQTDAVGWFAGN